jgi:hypothetical protein
LVRDEAIGVHRRHGLRPFPKRGFIDEELSHPLDVPLGRGRRGTWTTEPHE